LDATLLRRFHEVDGLKTDHCLVSPQQARLIGTFFCEEYSFEAAALFPRRVGGRYAMLGRQDHESIWIATSDDLNNWEDSTVLLSPMRIWEFVQIGNGGSPIEIDEGWLVITHGVGAARTYCLGVCLLDRDDPSIVLARSSLPLIAPGLDALDGYVPNVVYTCGAMVHNRVLVLPYAVADSFTTFATIALDRLLAAMH
jgi:predicted GH43/DUF377 family glycosyl hydrolase